jgi:hypothetical protein
VGCALVGVAALLVPRLLGPDEASDATYSSRGQTQEDPGNIVSLGEVLEAEVTADGTEVIFSARMASPIPRQLDSSSVDWHWEVTGPSGDHWLVSASLNVALSAAVLAEDGSYSSTTIDESMPGSVDTDGAEMIVRLELPGLERFPKSFTWRLTTAAIGDRAEPEASRVEDSIPDEGAIDFP